MHAGLIAGAGMLQHPVLMLNPSQLFVCLGLRRAMEQVAAPCGAALLAGRINGIEGSEGEDREGALLFMALSDEWEQYVSHTPGMRAIVDPVYLVS